MPYIFYVREEQYQTQTLMLHDFIISMKQDSVLVCIFRRNLLGLRIKR